MALSTWAPTYDASGAMTWTSVTTNRARYVQVGKLVYFILDTVGTTGGVASTDLRFTLPIVAAVGPGLGGGLHVVDGTGVRLSGFWTWGSTSQIVVRRYDAANWGLGGDRGFCITGFYEVA